MYKTPTLVVSLKATKFVLEELDDFHKNYYIDLLSKISALAGILLERQQPMFLTIYSHILLTAREDTFIYLSSSHTSYASFVLLPISDGVLTSVIDCSLRVFEEKSTKGHFTLFVVFFEMRGLLSFIRVTKFII